MKKALISVAVVLVLVIGGLLAAPSFIPVGVYRDQVSKAVKEATGRELAIGGDVSLALFPSVELRLGKVAFANAPGAKDPHMATLERLVLALQVMPLLKGQIRLDSFVLDRPVIHLEKNKAGQGNWEMGGADAAAAKPGESGGGGSAALADVSLGDVRLVKGLVTYADPASGQKIELSEIDMKIALPGLDKPLKAEGGVNWNAKRVKLVLGVEKPRALIEGAKTPVNVSVDSEPVQLSFDGGVAVAKGPDVAGKVNLKVPSIRNLAAWTGNPIAMAGNGLGPASIAGAVEVKDERVAFKDVDLAVDQIKGKGALAIRTGGARPKIDGRLETGVLDLNPYMPPASRAQKAPPAKGKPGTWSTDPIDMSGLKAADVEMALGVEGIRVQEIKIGRSTLKVSLDGGVLNADLAEMQLYNGKGKANVRLDAKEPTAKAKAVFSLTGVNALPLLKDAADLDWLEGTAEAAGDLTTHGRSERDLVGALDGSSNFKFTNGAIVGINLAAMVRNAANAFLDPGAGTVQKTDFAELSGAARIEKGIVRNNDLKMFGPLIRVGGAGKVDLPARTVEYRVDPKAVASLEGQGGEADKVGISIPVLIKGPWHDISYAPDLAGIAESALAKPGEAVKAVKGTVEGVKDTVKDVKKGVTGGVGSLLGGDKSKTRTKSENPTDVIKGIFGK